MSTIEKKQNPEINAEAAPKKEAEAASVEATDVAENAGDNYINDELIAQVCKSQNVKARQVKAVLQLLAEDATVPFIARYRKEATGNLDENQIRAISDEYAYGEKLYQRKQDVMRLIEERGKLTPELIAEINACMKLSEIEDIYRPYKEKKKTRATEAKKKGLEPLAEFFLSFPETADVEAEAAKYVTPEDQRTEAAQKAGTIVSDVAEAIQGAEDIVAEIVADDASYRKWIRSFFYRNAKLSTKVRPKAEDEKQVYEMYYDYSESIREIKPHRILAINRGEADKVLKVGLEENILIVLNFLNRHVITNQASPTAENVARAIEDGYKRLIKPSIERELRSELKEKAENRAIKVFAENLKHYLLTAPMHNKIVLGVDPAFIAGCKVAVVDATGKFLEKNIIYPTINKKESELGKFRAIVIELIKKYNVDIVAIGNGTASRETEAFIAQTLKGLKESGYEREVKYCIVNEAGASVYSAGEIAQAEFPEFSVEERSAISIARRLQDPLAELIKIDPKSIGVGQYQHDVDQKELSRQLDFVVESAVNEVGVNLNTASASLLQHVSGLNSANAKAIVEYRDEKTAGGFVNRQELANVKGLGEKTLEQALGFLRVADGDEPLDTTPIHPESYGEAVQVLERLGCTKADIGSDKLKQAIAKSKPQELLKDLTIGEYTLKDILEAFIAPNRDPRDEYFAPVLRDDVLSINDVTVGMKLQGAVRNVVDFGAFVDCGLHEDGLVHISNMKGYVKHPLEVVSVGDIITVWVKKVDKERGRLELSMIEPKK